MKKFLSNPKPVFTYLVAASAVAIAAGIYLGVILGMPDYSAASLFSAAGILLWAWAWGEFMTICLRLRQGESAFTVATGRTLRIIGGCMIGLAIISLLHAWLTHTTLSPYLFRTPSLALPVTFIFLAVALAAKILCVLLEHAMALEEEQEGVV